MTKELREKPIIFSAEMVRAILDGRKTQTRRVIKGVHSSAPFGEWNNPDEFLASCPYGQQFDYLWVRESFGDGGVREGEDVKYVYRADSNGLPFDKWKPSIHMPRQASRITLEITNIRVERVQDISEDDAKAEGCLGYEIKTEHAGHIGYPETYKAWRLPQVQFQDLWDSINAKRGYGWDANPLVWVIEFEKV